MTINWFGKTFYFTAILLIIAELLSITGYIFPIAGNVMLLAITALVFISALKKLELGLFAVYAELFVGGQGYLFSIPIGSFHLSIRIALFIAVMTAWLIHYVRGDIPRHYYLPISLLLLATTVAIGLLNGLIHQSARAVYYDSNAWLFFAFYLVVAAVIIHKNFWDTIVQTMTAATIVVSLKTITVLFLFSHAIAHIGGWFYRWIRDTGVGEITYMSGTVFRIFFQSHVYVLIGFFIIAAALLFSPPQKKFQRYAALVYLYLASLVLIISQSRSYWLGALAAIIVFCFLAIVIAKVPSKKVILYCTIGAIALASQTVCIQLITGDISSNPIVNRFKDLRSEPAGISRLNELQPLTNAIIKHPFFGYGFAKTLTYKSDDPRITDTTPDGMYTTTAFEWGFLDMWLKIGFFGLAAYIFFLGVISYRLLKKIQSSPTLAIGLLCALAAIVVTNIFSPYLNHPLGISFVLLTAGLAFPKS